MSGSIRQGHGVVDLPGDFDEPDRGLQVPADRVSHARPVWSAWNLSLMVRAGPAGRKGVVRGELVRSAFRVRIAHRIGNLGFDIGTSG